ncbi:SSI family serine proteinase inhibitor [Streptomyces sp. NPDC002851]
MLRHLAVTAAASLAALTAAATTTQATDRAPLPVEETDHLTVTVTQTRAGNDGTYELHCGSHGTFNGLHPDAAAACDRLKELTDEGVDPFAPTPTRAMCTMQHGGPGTARITGVWQGRTVDATYDRGNGCEIERWDRLVPVLPETGGMAAAVR